MAQWTLPKTKKDSVATMEKQRKSGGKPPLAAAEAAKKKLPSDRVFGANALELSEKEASKLVGGIVEKGIADNFPTPPSSAPRPSVLPFPVARHRAHGPVCLSSFVLTVHMFHGSSEAIGWCFILKFFNAIILLWKIDADSSLC